MTLAQFDNGYWYAAELKDFAETIGIPSANKLRKDELETAIKHFLKTGKIKSPTERSLSTQGPKDVESGLSLDLPVVVYTNDKETKAFLDREAQKLAPGLKRKSGARYRPTVGGKSNSSRVSSSHTETWSKNTFDSIRPRGLLLKFPTADTSIF